MATIKKLILRGFKSFAKRIELPFENNFSCFLGANGSGKSNICDAICFVLGTTSAKTLRAEKSANLIYNGGKHGNPLKEAEVSIVFCNKKKDFSVEGKEVMISRIVKQTGQSVYKINNETRTRQQIVDLLSQARINPDGHNIILQGDIVHFTEMRPIERRELVDDIAGILTYEEKKAKAMHELEKVQNKLNEADIILTERQKTLSELKKDRDQARKFKEKEDLVKRSKATRLSLLINGKSEKIEVGRKKLDKMNSENSSTQKSIDELQKEREKKDDGIKKINAEMDNRGDIKQLELSKSIDDTKSDLIKHSTRKDVCINEIRKLTEREKQLEKEEQDIEKKIADLGRKKDNIFTANIKLSEKETGLLSNIDGWKAKHGLSDAGELNDKLVECDSRLDKGQKGIFELNAKKQEIVRLIDKADFEIKAIEAEQEKYKELEADKREKLEKLKKSRLEFKEVARKLADALNENSVFASQLGTARAKLHERNEELSRLKVRSMGIRELTAGNVALKKLKSSNFPGVYGTVSELGNVSSSYAVALEVAAGSRLKSVVVNNDSTAAKCINMLKASKTGVLTFLPLNKIRERVIGDEIRKLKALPGVHGMATDFISHDSKFKTVFKYVFGPTLIVDDMATARKIGVGRARMVTLEGDLLETSGAMIGGFRRKIGMGFQEKELNVSLTKIEDDVRSLEKAASNLEGKKQENDESIIGLRERKAKLEAEIEAIESITGKLVEANGSDRGRLNNDVEKLKTGLTRLDEEIKKAEAEIAAIGKERQSLRDKVAAATSSDLGTELEKKESGLKAVKESIFKNNAEVQGLDAQIKVHKNELGRINSIITGNEKEKEDFTNEAEQLKGDETEKRLKLKDFTQKQKKFYAEYQGLFKKRDKLKNSIIQIEQKIIKREERGKHMWEKINDLSVRIAENEGELAGLGREFEEFKNTHLRRGVNLEQLNAEVRNLEAAIRGMGNVNLRALEVYEKASKECNAILEKCETLKQEKGEVLAMMFEIDTKKKDVFMKTFKVLAKNFEYIFSTLSTKGTAHLRIENQENPFEGGLGIEVKIGTNKFLDLKSLSGGEKTLAALAFIFAIQEFEPAPFYLLDEVDAALDKKNSELLSKLIAQYSGRAQYITISHNDSVISEAEVIYGVSMQDGASKVVSLKI